MVISTSVSSWLRGQLKRPEKIRISHILQLSHVAFPRTFGFAPPRQLRHGKCIKSKGARGHIFSPGPGATFSRIFQLKTTQNQPNSIREGIQRPFNTNIGKINKLYRKKMRLPFRLWGYKGMCCQGVFLQSRPA